MSDAIKFWEFYDAPKDFQRLSGFGGDEEWIFFVPEEYIGGMPPSHDGWPDLPSNVERAVVRLSDTVEIEWHEVDGDWVAITCRG